MANRVTAYLALGSNVGDRMAFLEKGEEGLKKQLGIRVIEASRVYETEPWPKELPDGHPHAEKGEKWFLNQVLCIETVLPPVELLKTAKTIEQQIGRTPDVRWSPREIDIDILLYGNEIVDTPELQIPHAHLSDRQFMLVPLVEIAPKLTDPMTGRQFRDILKEIQKTDTHQVTPFL